VAFALETLDGKHRALKKLQQKNCNFVVLNAPTSINQDEASFQVFDATGELRKHFIGSKGIFAEELLRLVSFENCQENS